MREGRAILTNTLWLALVGSLALAGPPQKFAEVVKDADGKEHTFEMVLIPGGTFQMGSPAGEEGREKDEGPQHEVKLDTFYLCTTEVTFDLFLAYCEETMQEKAGGDEEEAEPKEEPKTVDAITGPTPLYGDPTLGWGAGQRPAIGMSWLNAKTFCTWLSLKTGKKYRLPTEAEWEYACRAGSQAAYFFGDDPAQLAQYAWYEENAEEMTHEVAQKKPNPWGLYDILGNVREWVHDYYSPDTYAQQAKNNPAVEPTGPDNGEVHVARGGAWDCPPEELRCADRAYQEDWWQFEDPQEPKSKWWLPKMGFIGFRVACEVE
ncbi:MAG: formylglycine-generating enzyme family protein [Candidatus Brocadiia bacterium]